LIISASFQSQESFEKTRSLIQLLTAFAEPAQQHIADCIGISPDRHKAFCMRRFPSKS
jgi:hypothetical protein